MTVLADTFHQYFSLQKEIYDYFGYEEDYVVFPIDVSTDYWWALTEPDEVAGTVIFSEAKEDVETGDPNYSNIVYYQRFLPKAVYRGVDYTMIVVDTNTDGNKFLQIFDNAKELKDPETTEVES